MKIPKILAPLVEDGMLDEVLRQLKSGKEAICYEVLSDGEIRIAKAYKDSAQRGFKNRSQYLEGRTVRNSRERRAIAKGSKYGQKQLEEAWQSSEVDALFRMHAAGVRVPTPHLFSGGVLLMGRIADAEGDAAPQLGELTFSAEEAETLHAEVMRQCALMLAAGLVHGDLSEFNVLLGADGPTIIDVPQAVDVAHNTQARRIFERDVGNITRFFSRFSPRLRRTRYGSALWVAFEKGVLDPEGELPGEAPAADTPAADTPAADTPAAEPSVSTRPQPSGRPRLVVVDVATSPNSRGPRRTAARGGSSRNAGQGPGQGRRGGQTSRQTTEASGRPAQANSASSRTQRNSTQGAQGGSNYAGSSNNRGGAQRSQRDNSDANSWQQPARPKSKKPRRSGEVDEKKAAADLKRNMAGLSAALRPESEKKQAPTTKKKARRRTRRRRPATAG